TRSKRDWSSDVCSSDLPWPVAIASTVLGILMIAGADVDARTYLLPDAVTFGAALAGIVAAPFIDPLGAWSDPWLAGASAVARARSEERRVGNECRVGGA